MWMKTLRQSRYPPPKSLRLRGLWSVFVVCLIVFISIILNVAHHSLLSEYTKMRCKDTNFLSYKHQNARNFIHIYDSLTLKQAFFRIFGCKFNRYQWYLPNFTTIQQNSTLNDISPQKSFLFIVPKSFSSLTLFTIRLFRIRPANIDSAKVMQIESRTCQACLSNYAEMQLTLSKGSTSPLSMQANFVNASIHFAVRPRTSP